MSEMVLAVGQLTLTEPPALVNTTTGGRARVVGGAVVGTVVTGGAVVAVVGGAVVDTGSDVGGVVAGVVVAVDGSDTLSGGLVPVGSLPPERGAVVAEEGGGEAAPACPAP
jgi:hypothetical protein